MPPPTPSRPTCTISAPTAAACHPLLACLPARLQEQEGDTDEEAAEAEADAKMKEPKKKVLKPPGYKKPPLPKARPQAEPGGEDDEAGPSGGAAGGTAGKKKQQQRRGSIGPEDFSQERRAVRDSTRQKVEEGELERKLAEKVRGCRQGACVGLSGAGD